MENKKQLDDLHKAVCEAEKYRNEIAACMRYIKHQQELMQEYQVKLDREMVHVSVAQSAFLASCNVPE